MENVYEITITKEVMKTETFTELVKFGDVSNQQKEDLMSSLKKKFGEDEEGVTINIVSTPTEKEPENYFGGRDNYKPYILYLANESRGLVCDLQIANPLLGEIISFPENTKSVFAYKARGHRRTTLLPNESLLFYFSIEKEKVVDLWKKGNIKELQKYNIIPKERKQRNLLSKCDRNTYVVVHPNHSVLIREIYKKMKNQDLNYVQKNFQKLRITFIAVFTCDEWRQSNMHSLTIGCKFCTHNGDFYNKRDYNHYDPDTNERILYVDMKHDGETKRCRVGTYKSTIDEKGNLRAYRFYDKAIINYDNDELKTYCEDNKVIRGGSFYG